ncbi:hypothetical protein A2U01_0116652, partial [Trifolium medium]|nr:hypothetical protein [Trifolium medium]
MLTSILLQIILLSHGGDYERNKEEATTITEEKDGNDV